ncbi:hypothetical protein [Bdellovibrio bacteriovorus]|uniref:hypothetical protein n=1 Tax=Bdellovibrio TaxID=958 RepID=UPI0035A86B07
MKQLFTLIMSLLISTSASAASAASAAEPFTPDETVPTGLESVPKNLTAVIRTITAMSGNLNIPELGLLQNGLQMYVSNREACLQDQARAATFCREETSPDLQKTLAGLNLVLAGVNSIAVNDSCKSFSKAMTIAQVGITAYTATCGLLRKKCNMSCAAAANGMKQILKGLMSNGATCKPPVFSPEICTAKLSMLDLEKKAAYHQVTLEASLSDKKSLHSKERLCQHTYGLLLASSGVSLLSVAKSLKEGKNCDEQSHSEGSGGSVASAAPVAAVAATTTPPAPLPETPKEVERAPTSTTEGVFEKRIEINKEPVVNSELREYLPGGRKAVVAGNSSTTYPEITGPGGKSNFEKMHIRFRELRLDAD